MDYQGALVLQFDPASNDQVKKFFESCLKKATKNIELVSQAVAVFSFQERKATRTYLLAQPRPNTGQAKDNDAVGFAFWYGSGAGKTIQARYLSGSNKAGQIASQMWSFAWEEFKPKVRKGASGVVEITSELDTEDNKLVILLVLMEILGHGFVV